MNKKIYEYEFVVSNAQLKCWYPVSFPPWPFFILTLSKNTVRLALLNLKEQIKYLGNCLCYSNFLTYLSFGHLEVKFRRQVKFRKAKKMGSYLPYSVGAFTHWWQDCKVEYFFKGNLALCTKVQNMHAPRSNSLFPKRKLDRDTGMKKIKGYSLGCRSQ